jgi:hypothetical protein
MKHLKWVALPLVAALSMTAFSSAFAQSESHRVFSASIGADGTVSGNGDWIENVVVTPQHEFRIIPKPGVRLEDCVATARGVAAAPPETIPLVSILAIHDRLVSVFSWTFNGVTGATALQSFDLVCPSHHE